MLHLLTNQITHIIVDVNVDNVAISIKDEADIFVIILLISKRLSDLTFLKKVLRKIFNNFSFEYFI
jgi:hypothetical protein